MSKDSKGLFSKLTGALSSMEINIVNAKIFTNSSNIAMMSYGYRTKKIDQYLII